jgi:hypothetical protein
MRKQHIHSCKKWETVVAEEQWLQFNPLSTSIISVLGGNINFTPNL